MKTGDVVKLRDTEIDHLVEGGGDRDALVAMRGDVLRGLADGTVCVSWRGFALAWKVVPATALEVVAVEANPKRLMALAILEVARDCGGDHMGFDSPRFVSGVEAILGKSL